MPLIVFTSNLQRHVDCPELSVAGATVGDALRAAFSANPRVRDYVVDEGGRLRRHVSIYVDGRRIVDRDGMSDAAGPDSRVYVMQALSGG